MIVAYSIVLPPDSSKAHFIEIGGIDRVESSMDSFIFYVVQILMFSKSIVGCCHHFAHVLSFLSEQRIRHSTSGKVAALLAPKDRGIPPFEGFLAGSIAEPTLIIVSVS